MNPNMELYNVVNSLDSRTYISVLLDEGYWKMFILCKF